MNLESTSIDSIVSIWKEQNAFFRSGATLEINFRKEMLSKMLNAMEKWEKAITDALWKDLHKSYEEAYLTEISIVKAELKAHLNNIDSWAARKMVKTPIKLVSSRSYIVKEPLGNALIIAPWNYPVQLLLNPLVGAISSGCTAVLKPSPYVPHVSKVIEDMIKDTFDSRYIAVVQGHRDVNTALLDQRWDIIFFTGSPNLGKTVMAAAAQHLTPVVLELGGKSPCIIDKHANIDIAAKRIAWGKTLNCGQTCIAPDYILIHKEVKEAFLKAFAREMNVLHGEDIKSDKYYVRIVNDRAFERIKGYFKDGDIIYGGHTDAKKRFIEPTIIENMSLDSPIMTEEIFGPVFPMITIEDNFLQTVTEFITSREKPLALYYFGKESDGWKVIRKTSSGGACINDVIMHIANEDLPFGGVGNSGMGKYHKKDSFDVFSNTRSVIATYTHIDIPLRYMPYRMFDIIKKLL